MARPRLISEVLEELRREGKSSSGETAGPVSALKGSRWYPGCPGDPACQLCDGIGYVHLDLPVGHRYFGRIFLCECTQRPGVGRTKVA